MNFLFFKKASKLRSSVSPVLHQTPISVSGFSLITVDMMFHAWIKHCGCPFDLLFSSEDQASCFMFAGTEALWGWVLRFAFHP